MELTLGSLYEHILRRPDGYSWIYKIVTERMRSEYWVEKKLSEARVVFVGNGRTGKTSVINNIIGNRFSRNVRSTLLLDLKHLVELGNGTRNNWKVCTRHQMSVSRLYQSLPKVSLDFKRADGERKLRLHCEPAVITDLVTNVKYMKKLLFEEEVSTKDAKYVQFYDFGGQSSFEIVHKMFLSSFGIFCVVFDCSRFSGKYQDSFSFWLQSVITHAPSAPIIVIGTHTEKASKKLGRNFMEKLNGSIRKLASRCKASSVLQRNTAYDFFPIENSISGIYSQIQHIRDRLEYVLTRGFNRFEKTYTKSILLGQILFMDNLQQEYTHISLGELLLLGASANFIRSEVENMLSAYSHAGLVFYVTQLTDQVGPKNLIILSPAWLATALSKFIHDPELHKFAVNVSKKHFVDYLEYIGTGFLSENLFKDVLKSYKVNEIEYLRLLSEAFLILVKGQSPGSSAGYYVSNLVPRVDLEKFPHQDMSYRRHFKEPEEELSHELFLVFSLPWIREAAQLDYVEEPVICKNLVRVFFSANKVVTLRFFSDISLIEAEFTGCVNWDWLIVMWRKAVNNLRQKKSQLI
eukprot:snap_masked-scaffold_50-processed-gene-1.63-mRNA-1 protein AED:1.00 eAED:1.00 QI:0/0/0/0/1/1/2/0/576